MNKDNPLPESITATFPLLEEFAGFLLNNLERVVQSHVRLMKQSNLPLLKHFSHLTENDLLELSHDSQKDFLENLQKGTALQKSLADLELFRKNENPLVKTSQVEAEDFVVGYTLRAKLFLEFIPEYTSDIQEATSLISELESFNSLLQTEGFRAFIEIKEAELSEKNRNLNSALDKLGQQKELLEAILDTSFDAIVAFDKDLRYTLWNSAMEEMSEVQRSAILGKTLQEIFPEQSGSETEDYFKRTLAGEKIYIPPSPFGKRKGFYEGYMAPLIADNGEVTGGISVIRDISDLKLKEIELKKAHSELEKRVEERTNELSVANKELQRINTELEDFAYTVSHDLKAPLRAINTIANFLKEDYSDKIGGDGASQLDLLTNRVKRMGSLIEGILHYAKAGRDEYTSDDLDLQEVLDEVLENIDAGPNVKIIVKQDLPHVKFPRVPLIQVIQNLVTNSIKYCDKPLCQIEIGAQKDPEQTKIFVKDNGPGVDEKYHEKIFRPFQTLAPRDQVESTGIGLAVVKKVVEMEGGKVWLESQPEKGCTFFISIPN